MTVFDGMCRDVLNCNHYVEWDLELEMHGAGRNYESIINCVSCDKVGQSYNIEEYPSDCPYKKSLEKYHEQAEQKRIAFKKKCEQEKIWKKLNARESS